MYSTLVSQPLAG